MWNLPQALFSLAKIVQPPIATMLASLHMVPQFSAEALWIMEMDERMVESEIEDFMVVT